MGMLLWEHYGAMGTRVTKYNYRTTAPRAAAVITWNQQKSDFLILINLRHAAIEWVSYNGM